MQYQTWKPQSTEKLPGSFPRSLIKNRNVDADHFVSTYLKNEQQQKQQYNIRLRNPFFSDFAYQWGAPPKQETNSQSVIPEQLTTIEPQREKSQHDLQLRKPISSSKSVTSMASSQKFVEQEQINQQKRQSEYLKLADDQLPAPMAQFSPREQQSIYKLRVSVRQRNKDRVTALPLGGEFSPNRSNNLPVLADPKMVATSLNQYQPPVQLPKRDTYERHDPIGNATLQDYRPKFPVAPMVNKYDRPQFKDYALNQFSAAQVIRAKNDIHGKYDFY